MRTCLAALMLILLSAVPCCAEGDAGFWNTMKPDTRMYYIAGWTDGLRNACGGTEKDSAGCSTRTWTMSCIWSAS